MCALQVLFAEEEEGSLDWQGENRLSGCTSGLSWLLRLAKREKNGLLMFL
jgi:hypothetical protein